MLILYIILVGVWLYTGYLGSVILRNCLLKSWWDHFKQDYRDYKREDGSYTALDLARQLTWGCSLMGIVWLVVNCTLSHLEHGHILWTYKIPKQ